MAQRLLSGFDALDKYSQDLLAKHAKKFHLSYMQRIQSLNIPLYFDFELETRQNGAGQLLETQRNSLLYSRNLKNNEGGLSEIRPIPSADICTVQDSETQERESTKSTKWRTVSASQRRPWRSELESIPNLDTLCQEERISPIRCVPGIPCSRNRSSFLSPRELLHNSMTAENAHWPPREDDMATDGTVTPTDNSRRAKNITDHKNSSRKKMCNRGNLQNTTKVSLSIEDEMKKSDVKIITVKQKTVGARVERVNGETHPDSYRIHDKFIFFNTLSDLQRNLTTNSNFYSTCQGPAGNTRIGTGTSSILQNNMGCNKHTIKTNKSILQTATLKRNNADKGLLSDKVVIHFLSADGTKQKVDFAKHGNISKEEQIKSNRKTCLQEAKPILQSLPTREMKDEPGHVGPIINGINPKKAVDINPSTRSRSHQASRSFCQSSTRATSSRSLRLNSVGEVPKWSYISISKPLSSPDNELSILQSNHSDSITSDVTMDIVRPDLGTEHDINCSVPLKTRPVVLENRKERRASVPAEVNALGTGFGDQSTTGCSGEETETESGEILELGSVRSSSPSVIELSGMKSAKNDSNEEQLKKASPTQVYVVTMPVISIPTAPIETSE